jgi:uncharacterized cupredoxin-like copper-binding protein
VRDAVALGLTLVAFTFVGACRLVEAPATPPPISQPGTSERPREVNLIARDYSFDPPELRLIPGETVLLHAVNAGLDVHEAVIGGPDVQAAWEHAEAATAGAPPGPTPVVSVPPDVAGLRVVVESGGRRDVLYTVPATEDALSVGCHIPGHYARGMTIPVRLVEARPEP